MSLEAELKQRAAEGFRLVDRVFDSDPQVVLFPFRADPREFRDVGREKIGVSPDGRAFYLRRGNRVILVNDVGAREREIELPCSPARISVSFSRLTVMYSCAVRENGRWRFCFFLSRDTFQAPWAVAQQQIEEYVPDVAVSASGDRAAFTLDGNVMSVSVNEQKVEAVGRGAFAAISPDGRYIAFNQGNQAFLYSPDSKATTPILRGRTILGPLRWSPDARYLMFSERFIHLWGGTRIVVLRMSDQETHAVLYPALDNTTQYYGWCILSRLVQNEQR